MLLVLYNMQGVIRHFQLSWLDFFNFKVLTESFNSQLTIDRDLWIKLWVDFQESFHPVEITEGLWIVPEWRNPPVRLHKLQVVLLISFVDGHSGLYWFVVAGCWSNKHISESRFGIWDGGTSYDEAVPAVSASINQRRRTLSGLRYRIRCSCNSSTQGASFLIFFFFYHNDN